MALRILVTGDIHIGRSSSKLPDSVDPEDLRAVGGWNAVVDHALGGGFDVVIVTGDVADQDNDIFEVIGPLEAGVRLLAERGIRTLAVAGNHDSKVLPQLADNLGTDSGFKLLGKGGKWERETIDKDSRAMLYVDGWSFPESEVREDPVASYPSAGGDGLPVLGVVHGDLDVSGSRYAPLSKTFLRSRRVDGWLLGHIHAPRLLDDARPFILYPGSPQALDFGETGAHGAWEIEVENGRVSVPRLVPLSFSRYEPLDVDVTGLADADAVESAVYAAIKRETERCAGESGDALGALALRVRISGRSPLSNELDAIARKIRDFEGSRPRVAIDDVAIDVLPEVDLAAIAAGGSPLAAAARLLCAVEETPSGGEVRALLRILRDEIERVRTKAEYQALLNDDAPADAELAELARRELARVVHALLAQQEAHA